MGWPSSRQAQDDCKCHLIWCPKRRRVLEDVDVRTWVQGTVRASVEEVCCWIEVVAGEEDHVHLVLACPPIRLDREAALNVFPSAGG